MIEVRALTKSYGLEKAVDSISFQVQKGEVVGFLGPNGAGKTTTMKMITGYLPPNEGTVLIDGLDVREHTLAIRRRIGYLPENTPLYHDMVTYDYLSFVAAMRGVPKEQRSRRIAEMTHACGLGEVLGKRIEALSKGFRQRVGLAQAMIHDPPILLLDEPTTGLDPNQIVEIRELIKSIGRKKTVILSTHILPEVQASCDRVLIIHRGELVADGTPQNLQAGFAGEQRVQFGVRAPAPDVAEAFSAWEHVRVLEQHTNGDDETLFTLSVQDGADIRASLFHLAVEQGWTLTELHQDHVNLEDVFRQLTAA